MNIAGKKELIRTMTKGKCPYCGKEFEIAVEDEGREDWLPCLPLESGEEKLIAGVVLLRGQPAKYRLGDGTLVGRVDAAGVAGIDEVLRWDAKYKYTPRKEELVDGR
ncbi:MAG: hypothetical protein WC912_09545 [Thermovirgaceae bacterium]|jgi:hypothetical protein